MKDSSTIIIIGLFLVIISMTPSVMSNIFLYEPIEGIKFGGMVGILGVFMFSYGFCQMVKSTFAVEQKVDITGKE